MAEIRRVALQSVDIGAPSKEKEKSKQIAPSFRFELNLSESNEEEYPEFNYSKLLKSAEKKKKKEKKKEDNNVTNGANPFDDFEDDEKILDVARYYESKYGNRKKSDYVDLGAGYDENDSFIDNTDAYDEIVPEEVTTVHGGFYVNSGPLEFKDSDNPNIVRNNINMDNENGNDEEESSDEDSEEDSHRRTNKRSLSSSDNDEPELVEPPKTKARVDVVEEKML